MPRRRYSDRQKAKALAVLGANGGNLSATSRATGIPIKTIADWRDDISDDPDQAELRNEEKCSLAEKLDRIAHQCAGLLPERLPASSVREIVGAMAQSIEKGALLRGQPTQILTIHDKANELADLLGPEFGEVALPVEDATNRVT